MPIDPENLVVRYCAEGIELEQGGQRDEALRLFTLAWSECSNAFERTIAAHYLARHQKTPEETLCWNQEALSNADSVGDDRVQEFYPSLYLNLGKSHEDLGNIDDARRFYTLAAERVDCLPESPYGAIVRRSVMDGLKRTESSLENRMQDQGRDRREARPTNTHASTARPRQVVLFNAAERFYLFQGVS